LHSELDCCANQSIGVLVSRAGLDRLLTPTGGPAGLWAVEAAMTLPRSRSPAMTKLTDIQILLLTTASSRADGSVLPPSDLLGELSTRVRKAIESLLRRGLIEELSVNLPDQVWRSVGDQQIGLAITAAGKAAITADAAISIADPAHEAAAPLTSATKIGTVLRLLERRGGATLDEIVRATGWLPHTTRAALTGLRKKGHAIARARRDKVSCYRIVEAG
jgi:hypothetical protein